MCDLYPVFKSCCGVSVRIAMLYIAILSIITGALINAALKKAGVAIASIETVKDLERSEDGDGLHEAVSRDTDSQTNKDGGFRRSGEHPVNRADSSEYEGDEHHTDSQVEEEEVHHVTTTTTTAATTLGFMEKVSLVNRNGMNLLASAFVCLGVLLLVTNFMRSPELALISVAACVAVAVSSLVLLAGVVGECTKKRDSCLFNKLDWFSSFIVTLFWFMYVFCWLFFAGVTNAFANGLY